MDLASGVLLLPGPMLAEGEGDFPGAGILGRPWLHPTRLPSMADILPGEPAPYPSHMPQEQELDFLKEEPNVLRRQLEEMEARIKELEAKSE